MSNSHDAEPDQAALDELMRAFADDDAFDIDEIVIVEQDPITDRSPVDDVSPTQGEAATGHSDVEPSVGSDDRGDEVQVDGAEAADEVHADDADDRAGTDDRGDEVHADGADAADEVHADGADDRAGTDITEPTPTIIRIDDYAGSSELPPADTPADPPAHTPADIPAGDEPASSTSDVISIAVDDDVPDAVYVEGSLDRDGSRTIVFIEDDDSGDALQPESERDVRRGIEPRMRERRVAVKRAQGRKRLRWILATAVLLLLAVAALAVLGSSLFAVEADQVTVTPTRYADPELVEAVIDDLVGTPVLRVDTQGAERDLEAIPWVDDAVVRADFPHAVTIEIREREAMTTYQGPDQRFRVLDREGRVLDVIDGYPLAYVLLGGPDPVDLEPGEFAPQGYAAASELAKNLTGSLRTPGRIEIIEVTADGSRLVMRLDDGTEVRFGEARDLFAKLVRLETVLTTDEAREPGVIDVSTSEVTL